MRKRSKIIQFIRKKLEYFKRKIRNRVKFD